MPRKSRAQAWRTAAAGLITAHPQRARHRLPRPVRARLRRRRARRRSRRRRRLPNSPPRLQRPRRCPREASVRPARRRETLLPRRLPRRPRRRPRRRQEQLRCPRLRRVACPLPRPKSRQSPRRPPASKATAAAPRQRRSGGVAESVTGAWRATATCASIVWTCLPTAGPAGVAFRARTASVPIYCRQSRQSCPAAVRSPSQTESHPTSPDSCGSRSRAGSGRMGVWPHPHARGQSRRLLLSSWCYQRLWPPRAQPVGAGGPAPPWQTHSTCSSVARAGAAGSPRGGSGTSPPHSSARRPP
mmetsp:Transcript_9310/g.29745  ORF Transcript_9310/g.29745 Transcript_9310/m.29745 type:complete len:301 (+) Transcript_9310:511-1413(+)